MRLWSIHPKYLDPAGLVALWREGLLAQKVLAGKTRGYTHHPQLQRFREHGQPRLAIANYLHAIADEADRRGYSFDRSKLPPRRKAPGLTVTRGQLKYEWEHLRAKLARRNRAWSADLARVRAPEAHPLFTALRGGIAQWERVR